MVRAVALAVLALAATSCEVATPSDPAAETRSKQTHYALLVGCTRYPYLEEKWWLEGPANDIALLEEVLTDDRFGVAPSRVTKLVGWPAQEKDRPTKRNIAAAFERLADRVEPGEQVIVVLAGHGSQQPVGPGSEDEEPDGLDEVFLAADVRGWNGEKGSVENAITDDEIRQWLSAIRKKNAAVWFLADSCHSGTLTRGAPFEKERERRLPPEVLIPKEVMAEARGAVAVRSRRTGSSSESSVLGLDGAAGNMVAMYAAQPHELTPELPLPEDGDDYHGLFSYVIAEVLSGSSSVLTYRELADRVASRYRALGRFHPTPILEGGGLDREVLGLREWPERPRILLGRRDAASGLHRLKAGDLHGLRPDSVLAVYPPADSAKADERVGHVRLVRVEPLESLVAPHEYGKMPAPETGALQPGSRCSIVYVDYGEMRLRVALQTQAVTHAQGTGPPVLEAVLDEVQGAPGNLVRRVADPLQADWFVRLVGPDVVLVPGSGWMHAAGASPAPGRYVMGSLESDDIAQHLEIALRRVARARHLLGLAKPAPALASGGGRPRLSLELVVDKAGVITPVPYGTRGRVLHEGDEVAFRVTNQADHALDVTLLFVDSGAGITAVFPRDDDRLLNRIQPGKHVTSAFATVTVTTVGVEQLVAIGVRGVGSPVDFSYLQQETVPRTRSPLRDRRPPLTQLLDSALYGEGAVRGLPFSDAKDYVVEVIGWEVARTNNGGT